ncbi:DUF1433 domain-containing protein [Metabacillus sp. JX24]|uniref:DUF1433 domain-containing protein n=1 Tax=Metabacillus sp. JX24 TaxID=3240759 RepID=UPI0035105302
MNTLKFITFCFIAFILSGALLTGCSGHSEERTKIEEAKKKTEDYIKENYLGIESVTFTKEKTNPMGILVLEGYLNGDEEKMFSLDYDYGHKDVIGGLVLADIRED